ncbi:D-glycero-alpha-D-manno-heptose-1,7-bisphosphate 7-phosphatase [Streptomyces tendae]|uniref:D-glycero-alpha-D-manno-heptose-1,7-bisphosphate 7-phosphatase n=1 Tax=Streptomyces tendae TaxID=1932 RepID=UPI00364ECA6D
MNPTSESPIVLLQESETLRIPPSSRPALLCDRDGTVIENRDNYVLRPEHIRFLPGAIDALQEACALGHVIALITNQSPIGRGLLSVEQALGLHRVVTDRLTAAGVAVSGTYLCPHTPHDGCRCRKPAPDLLNRAVSDLRLTLADTWYVGDALSDVGAARAAGVRPVLTRTGRGAAQERTPVASEILDGVDIVDDLTALVKLLRRSHL